MGEPALMKKIVVAALVLSTACIGVKRAVLVDRSDHPVPLEEVTVFLPEDEIPEGCERIAVLAAAGDYSHADFGDLLERLREEAGELGANAIHIRIMSEAANWQGTDLPEIRDARYLLSARRGRDARAFALHCLSGTGQSGAS